MSDDQIAALRHERERHVLGGRVERVAAIDAELAALGADAPVVNEPPAVAPLGPLETATVPPGGVETADAPRPAV